MSRLVTTWLPGWLCLAQRAHRLHGKTHRPKDIDEGVKLGEYNSELLQNMDCCRMVMPTNVGLRNCERSAGIGWMSATRTGC